MKILNLFAAAILIFGSSAIAETQTKGVSFDISISSKQMDPKEQLNDSCYRTAHAAEKVASVIGEQVVPKLAIAVLDEDAIYRVIETPGGTVCKILTNPGANDMAWGFGARMLVGCSCKISAEVK